MMDITIIVNPTAGNGKALKRWEAFSKRLDFPYDLKITSRPREAAEITKECTQSPDYHLVIAFGGDGTAHEVIEGASGRPTCIVGVIGAGSGNDFGRGFQSFRTPNELNDYVSSTLKSKAMDAGLLQSDEQDYFFVNNAGIGFDAFIAFQVNKSPVKKYLNKLGLGKLAYTYYLISSLVTFRRFKLSVETKDHMLTFQHVWFATVSNQPYFGGGMEISPISNAADGKIELTVVHNLSRLKLLLVFVTVFFGKHTNFKEVHQFQSKSFSLTTEKKIFRHTDGEFAGKTQPHKENQFTVQEAIWNITNLDPLDVSPSIHDNRYAKRENESRIK